MSQCGRSARALNRSHENNAEVRINEAYQVERRRDELLVGRHAHVATELVQLYKYPVYYINVVHSYINCKLSVCRGCSNYNSEAKHIMNLMKHRTRSVYT
jgi:hypothetical protein